MLFPTKLYFMILEVSELAIESPVINWNEDGDKFIIYDPTRFSSTLLLKYFRTRKLSSFQRQLNSYNFKRINKFANRKDPLIYTHNNFHRDQPQLLSKITRRLSKDDPRSLRKSSKQLKTGDSSAEDSQRLQPNTPLSPGSIFTARKSSSMAYSYAESDQLLDSIPSTFFDSDDFYMQLPESFCITAFSMSDWDAEKETLKKESFVAWRG